MGSLGWAVGLSMLSAASYAAAAVAQERLADNGHRGLSRWAIALTLTAGGVGLHVWSLNFGTVAVVQALGTLTLLFALPITRLRYGTPIGFSAWADATLTVSALALIMSLSVDSGRPAVLSARDGFFLALATFLAVAALAGAGLFAVARVRAVLLAASAGIAFGISSVLSKAVMAALAQGGTASVSLFVAAMVVLFSVSGYSLSQLSYQGAGLAAPLATVSVTNPIAAAVAGVLVFGEGFRFGRTGLAVVAVAVVAMTLGVIGLARRTTIPDEDEPAYEPVVGDLLLEPVAEISEKLGQVAGPEPRTEVDAA